MNRLSGISIKIKLPLAIMALCAATVIALEWVVFAKANANAEASVKDKFVAISAARVDMIRAQALWIEEHAILLAHREDIAAALADFSLAFKMLADPAAQLSVIDFSADRPSLPEGADAGVAAWLAQHNAHHRNLLLASEDMGVYDLFLFDADLNAIYTAAKEPDFAASFRTGPLAESGLGRALAKAEEEPADQVFFSDFAPYAPSGGAFASFAVVRMASASGRTLGYVGFQISTGSFTTTLNDSVGMGATGQSYLLGGLDRGNPAEAFAIGLGTDPNEWPRSLGDIAALPHVAMAGAITDQQFFSHVPLTSGATGYALVSTIKVNGTTWHLVLEQDADEVLASNNHMRLVMALTGLAICVAAAGLGLLVSRALTQPLDRARRSINALAGNDLDITITDTRRGDELGSIATALSLLRDRLATARQAEDERQRQKDELARVVDGLSLGLRDLSTGDLTRPIGTTFAQDYEPLRQAFNISVEALAATVIGVIEAARNIRSDSGKLTQASEDLSRRTENQAAALEQTAAALDEMTASVRSAADGAREVETIVAGARIQAEESGAVVQGAVSAMDEIKRSSEKISQIIGVIDDIAFQTNLLALNAGVEAARAGDAGRGFAVVASEVRALAQRSSTAAREIKSLIAVSGQQVGRGVEQVGLAGAALNNIVGSVANISTLITRIASGAEEQSTGLNEINVGVTQLDQVTQQNAAMVQEAGAAVQSLLNEVQGLNDRVGRFKVALQAESDIQVDLSAFVPTDFAGSATLYETDRFQDDAAPAAGPFAPHPATRAASSGTAAMWQEF